MRVQIEVGFLARNAIPEVDVRLVPHFEIPFRYFVNAVTIDKVLREMPDEVIPAVHALRRRDVLLVPEWMQCVRIERKLTRHEADFNEGPDAVFEQPIVNLVDVGKVVDGIAVLILVINADFIVEDSVEARHIENLVTRFTAHRSSR